jgi:DNA-binding SARP family transcriptional activator
MTQLKLFLFGPPRIIRTWGERAGQRIEVGLQKALALLVYLVVTKRLHSRESLATLFWPDTDQRTALGNLRRALYRLNQALNEDVILATRKTAEFNRKADFLLDIDLFQEHVAACVSHPGTVETLCPECLSRLTVAAGLYTDHFLAGFTLPDSPAFDEWQFFQAEELRRLQAKVLEGLTHTHQAQGDWEEAINYARRWVALDPLEEPAQRCLMALYAQSNQRAAALRQYQQCDRILTQELGIKPDNETTALYEAIKYRQVSGPKVVYQTPRPVQTGGESINLKGELTNV